MNYYNDNMMIDSESANNYNNNNTFGMLLGQEIEDIIEDIDLLGNDTIEDIINQEIELFGFDRNIDEETLITELEYLGGLKKFFKNIGKGIKKAVGFVKGKIQGSREERIKKIMGKEKAQKVKIGGKTYKWSSKVKDQIKKGLQKKYEKQYKKYYADRINETKNERKTAIEDDKKKKLIGLAVVGGLAFFLLNKK